ncbi:hypothetical protein [Erythrobacter sp. YT30]|uniref:hypothetical protein n=1 Tax=Erythrobacter sp. YT30 TaxID=1735012 RepID=UPI00076BE8A5|nr:hypothetical protein [Erythrobacter sp. YT30]KWV91743.1 hypothetical protein AUC45_11095 [Erythrobacter sp. YT30]
MKVYVANFGQGNSLWPLAKANSTLATFDDVRIHPFWKANDRAGYIEAAQNETFTALGHRPTRQTAGRWFNIATQLSETAGDLWISRQGDEIWWSFSTDEPMRESLQKSDRPERNGPEVFVLEKPCSGWSDRDADGRPLRWNALHPKARDFLSTEATFQSLSSGELSYAEYAQALVNGEPLDHWHDLPVFQKKLEEAQSKGGHIFSPKEIMAARLADTMLGIVRQADGRTIQRKTKVKVTTLSRLECEQMVREIFDIQEGYCAYSGLRMQLDGEEEDKELLVSLDRIDSDGHYTPENLHLVCRFINRWKGADPHDEFERLLSIITNSVNETS